MLKRDLLEFINRVETKAINSVCDKYNKLIEIKKVEVLSKYKDRINMYQDSFNRLSTNIRLLLTDLKEDGEVAYSSHGTIENRLKSLEGNRIEELIFHNSSYRGEVEKIKNERDKEIKAVKDNYYKVYIVSKNMSSAKKIAEYLEGIGFDISTLKEDEIQALTAELDISKLFVCGDNH